MARATGFDSLKNEENKEIKSEKMDMDVVEIKKAVGFGDSTEESSQSVEKAIEQKEVSCENVEEDVEEDAEEVVKLATLSMQESRKLRDKYKNEEHTVEDAVKEEENSKAEEEDFKAKEEALEATKEVTPKADKDHSVINEIIEDSDNSNSGRLSSLWKKFSAAANEFNEHPLRVSSRVLGTMIASRFRKRGLKKIKKRGAEIISGDFTLIKSGNALLVWKYNGANANVVVPATVGNLPVIAIHPNAFTNNLLSGGPLMSFSTRSIAAVLKGNTLESVNTFDLANSMSGIKSVKLPNTLTAIYEGTFSWCKSIEEIVVPESVVSCSVMAFSLSDVKRIIFNGSIPSNFKPDKFNGEIWSRYEK